MIEEYRFGLIVVGGKNYNYDVEVRRNGEILKWQREKSHIFSVEDLKRAFEQNPEFIVIGTGESGVAKVSERAQNEASLKGIKLVIDRTGEAVRSFNLLLERDKKIIGLFHLTC